MSVSFRDRRPLSSGFWNHDCQLLALTLFKYVVLLHDIGFMGNYHYMPFIMTFAWLLIPHKHIVAQMFLFLFYFAAGLLKLDTEWLSGASVGRFPTSLPDITKPVAMAYVVLLELVLIFGLWLGRSARLATLAQLIAFHAVSWYWVGWYYPVNMYTLLLALPLAWRRGITLQSFDWARAPKTLWTAAVLFVVAQALPWLSPRDPALGGDLRITSLNMFDARTQCFGTMILKHQDQIIEYDLNELMAMGLRIRCDPSLFVAEARNFCREGKLRPEFKDLNLVLISRRTTDAQFKPTLTLIDFCAADARMPMFHWARSGGQP